MQSEHGSDHGQGVQRFMLDESDADFEIQAVRARVKELEDHAKRLELERRVRVARVIRKRAEPRRSARPCPRVRFWAWVLEPVPMNEGSAVPLFPATQPDIDRGFTGPFSETERVMLDALHGATRRRAKRPSVRPSELSTRATPARRPTRATAHLHHHQALPARRRRKKKKGNKKPYAVKSAAMPLPQFPNALTFLAWRRSVRTAIVSCCERPERARAFAFSCEDPAATFETLAIADGDRHRALDAKLADALQKIVRGDLARRLAVRSEALARNGLVLSGRQILWLVYREFSKDSHMTDAVSYSHLEKLQGSRDLKGLETLLTVWDALQLNFMNPPQADHLYASFLSKIRHIPEMERFLKTSESPALERPQEELRVSEGGVRLLDRGG